MEVRIVGERRIRRRRQAEAAGQQLDQALGVVQVVRASRPVPGRDLGGAGQRQPEPPPLVGVALVRRAVALADLEDGDVGAVLAQVRRDDLEQAAEEGLAQDRVLAGQRIGDRDRPAAGSALADDDRVVDRPEPLDHRRGDEGERHRLGQPGPDQCLADELAQPERRRAVVRHRRVREDLRDDLVAADARDLLRDVRLDGEVPAPARDRGQHGLGRARVHLERHRLARHGDPGPGRGGLGRHPDPGEQVALLRRRQLDPEQPVHPRRPERHPGGAARRSGSCRRPRPRPGHRPIRRRGGPCDRRRAAPAGAPGPSRSGGWPPSAAHSGRPSGGC